MSVVCPKNYGSCGAKIRHDSSRLFVLMPFSEKIAPQSLFFDVLQPLPGWDVHRADSDLSKPEIWCKICVNIQESRAVIADLSGSNPNVFLELGIAWGFGKPLVLLTQDTRSLPFDTKSYHVIEYMREDSEVTNPEKIQSSILKALNALPPYSPVWDSETPEAFLESRIKDAKKKTVHLWRRVEDGWQIAVDERVAVKIGISLLKDYPRTKPIDQISFEAKLNQNTIRAYLSSRLHGFSQYFVRNEGMIGFSSEGIYWFLDEIIPNM